MVNGWCGFMGGSKFKSRANKKKVKKVEENSRREVKENYKKWVMLEETSWMQKSREIWLKKGHRNSSFFSSNDKSA